MARHKPESEPESIEALVAEGTVEAAGKLQILAAGSDKAISKEARRALYRLKLAGIEPPAAESPDSPAIPVPALARAFASNYGGNGRRLILIVRDDPHGGSPVLFSVVVSDTQGLLDVRTLKLSRREAEQKIAAARVKEDAPLAEIPLPYGRWLLRNAEQLNRDSRSPIPQGFSDWAGQLGGAARDYERSLVYDYIEPEQVQSDPPMSQSPEALFEKEPFTGWVLDPRAVEPWEVKYFETQQSPLALEPDQLKQRGDAVIDEAADALLPSNEIARWRHRLEETALVLHLVGRTEEAQRAIYHASTMSDSAAHDISFARFLTLRSIYVVIAVKARQEEDEERRDAETQGRGDTGTRGIVS